MSSRLLKKIRGDAREKSMSGDVLPVRSSEAIESNEGLWSLSAACYGSPKHLTALSHSIFCMTSSPSDFHASTLFVDSGKRDSACG